MSSDVILHEFHCSNQVSVRRPKQFPICIQPFQNDISVWCRRLRPAFHLCVSVCERERIERLSNASINLVLRMRMCGCKKYKCIFDDNIPTYSTVSAFNFRSSPGEVFFIDLPPSTSSVPSCESLWNGWKTCKCHIEKFEICTCWFEVSALKSCSNWHVSGSFNVTLTLESDATDHRSLVSNCTAGLSRPIPNQIVGVENWIGNWMHFRIKL